jgi:ankyrin repeat protein
MGYDRVIKLLAEKGANLNVKNSRGLTPLAALRGRNNSSTADLLRKLGAVD